MSTDRIRAALQALTELEGHTLVDCTADWAEAMIEARAALAAEADGPAVQSREPASVVGEPSDEELLDIAAQAIGGYSSGIKLGEYEAENEIAVEAYGSELITFARAVLARYGNQPAPVAESEVKDRVTWLQKFAAVDWIADETADKLYATAKLLEQCYCPASVPVGEVRYAKDVRRMCEIILGNTFGNEELDSLALLVGHHPDVLNASTVPVSSPLPVAAGEVAELVEFLRVWATLCPPTDKPSKFTRAADLLEQRHPTPVPVSEHPWKRDRWCDDEDRCWCFNQWDLQWELENYTSGAHWCDWMLPSTALPLPQGEVK